MDHPVPSTAFCVNQVLTLGKDQLQAQQNSLPSPSQPTSLSQLETKVMTIELTLFAYIYNFSSYIHLVKGLRTEVQRTGTTNKPIEEK